MARRNLNPQPQRGLTLIVLLFIIGLAATAYLLYALNANQAQIERDKKTAAALAEAKVALISYAIARDDNFGTLTVERPGEFPCPDTTNDGVAESSCIAGRLGRVPWKTLNIDAPLDGSGEVLWYSLSGPFRNKSVNAAPINSDTKANLVVKANDGAATLAQEAVAVIFAPGPAVPSQLRGTSAAPCPTTGTNIAENLCAANYLESSSGVNNATTNGPFIDGVPSGSYNDRVAYISTRDFIPEIEKRVGVLLRTVLVNYAAANAGLYPWPDQFSGGSADGVSDVGITRGRLPLTALPVDWGGSYALPNWFMDNQWYKTIYYAIGALTLDGALGPQALFFMPGTPVGVIARPSGTLSDYLEDPENNDGDDVYVTPTSSSRDRDRIYVLL